MNIDCVIIGVNAEATLARCIRSVLDSAYSRGEIHVWYADGGSTDRSVAIARENPSVSVLELTPEYPAPGIGRNAGWRPGNAPCVQFLDSDTILDPGWLEKAVVALKPDVAAVRGNREEINPEASVFNWLGSLEWNAPPGECDDFGGDVLVRRSVLEETGGYDEILVGGEDPELSRRIRNLGWKIIQLDEPMTLHDLAMTSLGQYWKRGYRSGYGFAAVTTRFAGSSGTYWIHELIRILTRAGGSMGLTAAALLGVFWSPWSLLFLLPASVLLFYPRLFSVSYFQREKQLSADRAKVYALHCSFVVLPQFFGMMRFYFGSLLGKPLRNRRNALMTRRSLREET